MLDRHRALAVPPETNFMRAMLGRKHADPPAQSHAQLVDQALSSDEMRDLALPREELLAHFSAGPATRRELFRSILTTYAARREKPRVGEKTPYHLWYVPT